MKIIGQQGLQDFIVEVARGNVRGCSVWQATGRNIDVDTGTEDIWSVGGVMTEPTTARAHNIASGDAADDDGSTGMTAVRVHGILSDGSEATEDVTLDGTNNVATTNSYTFINRLEGISYGSGGTNAGLITATAQTDSTVSAQIAVGAGRSQMTHYRVPAGKKGLIYSVRFSAKLGTAALLVAELRVKPSGSGGFNLIDTVDDRTTEGQSNIVNLAMPHVLNAGDTVKMRLTSASDDVLVSGGIGIVVVPAGS